MYVNRVAFEFSLHITQSTAPFSIPPHAVPGAPPQLVKAYAESSTSIRVVWQPPPENKRNGRITYYKIFVVPDSRPDSEAAEIDITKDPDSAREYVIDELRKYSEYRVWMLAGTQIGDGPASPAVVVKTDEDGAYLLISFCRD